VFIYSNTVFKIKLTNANEKIRGKKDKMKEKYMDKPQEKKRQNKEKLF
jgi:hypothetical protein